MNHQKMQKNAVENNSRLNQRLSPKARTEAATSEENIKEEPLTPNQATHQKTLSSTA